jgi:signal transduction histidine kinase
VDRERADRIIQGLYAVALSLEDVPAMMATEPAEAAARVDRAIDDLGTAIGAVRSFMMDLGIDQTDRAPGPALEAGERLRP